MLNILSKLANAIKSPRFDAWLEKLEGSAMPLPVTVNDCLLVDQMGYEVHVNDGCVTGIKRKRPQLRR